MRKLLVTLLLLASPFPLHAQSPTEALATCLADSTTGRDRKDLAQWVFFAIAAHPEMEKYVAAGAGDAAEAAKKSVGSLFTRLLTESCVVQAKAAAQQGGSQAIGAAFETFGRLAMGELMSNPAVGAAMGSVEKYTDQQKINAAFGAP